jgi:hypothetical protein
MLPAEGRYYYSRMRASCSCRCDGSVEVLEVEGGEPRRGAGLVFVSPI